MANENLVVLIPSYQPDETLVFLTRGLKNEGFKVLVVDDGSGTIFDKIFEEAKEYATVLRYEKNHGKGYALRYGFTYIKENLAENLGVITADGDGQHRILDIIATGERLVKKDKAVLGVRSFNIKIPIKSKIGNDMSKFTQSLVTHTYLSDNQCGLRAFPIRDLDFYLSIGGDRYEYEMKVISAMQLKCIPYETIEIETIYENNNAKTHFRPFFDTVLIQKSILLSGLFNFIFFTIEVVLASLLYYLVVPKVDSLLFDLESVIIISSIVTLILKIVFTFIIYRPQKYKSKLFKEIIFAIFITLGYIVTSIIFVRFLGVVLPFSYLITFFLTLFPLYYFTKGLGIFFEAQRG